METTFKTYWGKYEFPTHKMVAQVVFPPEWNKSNREEMLNNVYGKTHRIQQDEHEADRYNLMAIPLENKNLDIMQAQAAIAQFNS